MTWSKVILAGCRSGYGIKKSIERFAGVDSITSKSVVFSGIIIHIQFLALSVWIITT